MPNSRKRKRLKPMQPISKKAVTYNSKRQYNTPEFLKNITHAYQDMISDILNRISAIRELIFIEDESIHTNSNFEIIALNFRKIAETIVYANLAGHRKEYDALYPPPQKSDWRISVLIERIKKINPFYYPQTKKGVLKPDANGVKKPTFIHVADAFSEKDLIEMYTECAKWLHARKESDPAPNFSQTLAVFKTWHDAICDQLGAHMVRLADGKYTIFCHFTDEGKARALLFMDLDEFELETAEK